jgi:serine/threonine protein phosphatase PrpC
LKLLAWSRTDTGRRRSHNEDAAVARADLGLFAVADGMGGHRGGERASRLAVDIIEREVAAARSDFVAAANRLLLESRARWLPVPRGAEDDATEELGPDELGDDDDEITGADLDDDEVTSDRARAAVRRPVSTMMRLAARKASAAVFAASSSDPELRGMGTTLTALLCEGGRGYLVHVGDSRAYLFRDGALRQLTDDHSWIAEQVKAGMMSEAEAQMSRYRHVITRSIGFEKDVDLDSNEIVIQTGDCFLLCSDGLSNYIGNDELDVLMRQTFYRHLPQRLIDLANERGGDDNITAVVVYAANG